jgi:Protein of unknown function (DUF1236)
MPLTDVTIRSPPSRTEIVEPVILDVSIGNIVAIMRWMKQSEMSCVDHCQVWSHSVGCMARAIHQRRRTNMNAYLRRGAIVIALLGSTGFAVAQSTMKSDSMKSGSMSTSTMARPGASLQLSATQKTAIYKAINPSKAGIKAPASLQASVGAQVPASVRLHALPSRAIAAAPAVRSFKYTVARNDVLLVDPSNLRVVEVIRQ